MMTKEELLFYLNDLTPVDGEGDHGDTENKIIEYIGDPDITTAFNERRIRNGWWYA